MSAILHLVTSQRSRYIAIWEVSKSVDKQLETKNLQALVEVPQSVQGRAVFFSVSILEGSISYVVIGRKRDITCFELSLDDTGFFESPVVIVNGNVVGIGSIRSVTTTASLIDPGEHPSMSISHTTLKQDHSRHVLVCIGSQVVIINRNLQKICTFQSTKTSVINVSIFYSDNCVLHSHENGEIFCFDISEQTVLWTIHLKLSKGDGEFITCLAELPEKRIAVSSQTGGLWILQTGFDEDNGRWSCWERSFLNLNKHIASSVANSVLCIALQKRGRSLVVITSSLIAIVNIEAGAVETLIEFAKLSSVLSSPASIPIVEASCNDESQGIFFSSAFDRKVLVLSVDAAFATPAAAAAAAPASRDPAREQPVTQLSFFQSGEELPDNSPLHRRLRGPDVTPKKPPLRPPLYGESWEAPAKGKRGELLDLPVTFHSRVRSSNYGQPDTFSKWKAAKKKSAQLKARASQSQAGAEDAGKRLRIYPVCGPPLLHDRQLDWPHSSSVVDSSICNPIRSLCYSKDGSSLGIVTSDSTVVVAKVSPGSKTMCNYMGHDARITSISFTHNKSDDSQGQHLILSSSVDGTCRAFRQGQVDHAALVLSHTRHSRYFPGLFLTRNCHNLTRI